VLFRSRVVGVASVQFKDSIIQALEAKQQSCACPETNALLGMAVDAILSQRQATQKLESALYLYKTRAAHTMKSNRQIIKILTEYATGGGKDDLAQTGAKTFIQMISRLEDELRHKQQQIEALREGRVQNPITRKPRDHGELTEKTASMKKKLTDLEESFVRLELQQQDKTRGLRIQSRAMADLRASLAASEARLAKLEADILRESRAAMESQAKWEKLSAFKDEKIQELEQQVQSLRKMNGLGVEKEAPETLHIPSSSELADREERKDDSWRASPKSPTSPNQLHIISQMSITRPINDKRYVL